MKRLKKYSVTAQEIIREDGWTRSVQLPAIIVHARTLAQAIIFAGEVYGPKKQTEICAVEV
jgi:hypothetical protein